MTTFLATMQFSFTPWDYDEEVVAICKKLLRLREKHFSYILAQCEKSVKERVPLIRPLWWFSDEQSALDSNDQFFVGDDLLVAPVLSEGEITRLVFLPDGEWRSGNDGQVYKGPVSIKVSAPLDELPHFERVNGGENFADSASLCAVI
jgi:alpha-glucosidase (family GH31 glycosyl hydrolase)